jgi:hypothetical protein
LNLRCPPDCVAGKDSRGVVKAARAKDITRAEALALRPREPLIHRCLG